ncbi:MAG TPA: hypothetical protein VEV85_06710, partial [Bryobacteraceae bacterium]|nr:hypothetical protein [Bryobacteraceae bacterium]
GASQGFLAPGTEKDITVAREDLGGISRLTISRADALRAIDRGQARVLEIERHGPPRDITREYESALRSELLASGAGAVAAIH